MNFGTPVPLLVGLILILGAIGLFFLDKLKPGYERSSDKVYSILLLISGIFLMAHLDMPLLASFQQVMLVGMLTTLIINDITKRESNRNRPAEREGPPRREGPRRVYRAELDDWDTSGPRQPQIPSNREGYRSDGYYDDRYGPRPLEPRPGYDERRPPARLQPGQPGRPEEQRFENYSNERPDNRRSDARTSSERPDSFYSNTRYDGGGSPPPNNRPQRPSPRPLDSPVTAGNGAGHSMGGLPQPPRNSDTRNGRPPLNVRPRPMDSTDGNYTDFRPAQPSDGNPEQNSDTPPPQPPANY
ncbi:MAG: Ycf66 family protein [Cyanobacteria bacterium J06649_12]